MTLPELSAGQPSIDTPSRWFYLVERVLTRWDMAGRVTVLLIVVTGCLTAILAVLFGALGAATVAGVAVALATHAAARPVTPTAEPGPVTG